ncbi:hypothetical protein BDR03DRAFT_213665 [Suillus americanus]|nr:hypothetical protein BDR03DRAFT_213665 [Suillus americanus]
MIKEIPESTALLDELSALKKQSQVMQAEDPHRLKDSLSFLVQPPESLSVLIGMLWLRGDHRSDVRSFLDTVDGWAWLQTQNGRDWLQTQGGRDWLQTQGGRDWLQTQGGRDWLQTPGGRDWLQIHAGRDWLQTWSGWEWLQIQTRRYWLQTQAGQEWLQTQTQAGRDWLQTQGERDFLQTQAGRYSLQTQPEVEVDSLQAQPEAGQDSLQIHTGCNWLQAQGGRCWLQTKGTPEWLQTQRGGDWLQTGLGRKWLGTQGGKDWIQTKGGRDWLGTQGGKDWLQTLSAQDWLQTTRGRDWVQTRGGQDWLQTRGGQDWVQTRGGQDWLQTRGGQDWVQTRGGQDWLQTRGGQDWLQTRGGQDWVQTRGGQDWLQTRGGQDWVQTRGGQDWLQTRGGQDWFQTQGELDWLQTQRGLDWLKTPDGRGWLRTPGGRDWLQASDGQAWQSTPAASVWVTMEEFSSTLEAISEYIIVPDSLPLLPTFQVVQQFKSLPDFLMFPVFLALMPQNHFTSALPEVPDREIIRAMNAFTTFANEAQERSQSASDAFKYACQNWVVHLSRAPNPWDDTLNRIFQAFWNRHLLSWLEQQWCLKGLRSCLDILSKGQKLAKFEPVKPDEGLSAIGPDIPHSTTDAPHARTTGMMSGSSIPATTLPTEELIVTLHAEPVPTDTCPMKPISRHPPTSPLAPSLPPVPSAGPDTAVFYVGTSRKRKLNEFQINSNSPLESDTPHPSAHSSQTPHTHQNVGNESSSVTVQEWQERRSDTQYAVGRWTAHSSLPVLSKASASILFNTNLYREFSQASRVLATHSKAFHENTTVLSLIIDRVVEYYLRICLFCVLY